MTKDEQTLIENAQLVMAVGNISELHVQIGPRQWVVIRDTKPEGSVKGNQMIEIGHNGRRTSR